MTERNAERALTLRLPSDLHDELRRRAVDEDRSVAQLVRVATRYYLKTPLPIHVDGVAGDRAALNLQR